ncbi:response regulator receiver domain [Pseudomonas aeruginosa]|uniref:response regulator receiver domain n=1 Tax=Pseudomonas aeruginosa TaxID=287 RepID=UPI000AA13C4D|nr:response regulator receiver domain [Pseudomonas aeruginosa]
MGSQGVIGEAATMNSAAIWSDHIQGAVKEFLKTAVVIDNQPWIREASSAPTPQVAPPVDNGLDADLPAVEVPAVPVEIDQLHDLDLRAVSDRFASNGIACAFVLPDDEDSQQEKKVARAVAAAKVSDLVIIDWYLKKKDSSLTLSILQEIARSDSAENGRLRLICVYTGEPLGESIFKDVKEYLQNGGITVEDVAGQDFCAYGDNALVVLKNKGATPASQLPLDLIKLFSRFADGLIPAFSLAAVGAIRKNAHHMLTRFGSKLDSAYIANRIITNPPSDVSEMLRDLFVSECDSALGLESVADRYLESEPIVKWINAKEDTISVQRVGGDVVIDKSLLLSILAGGVRDHKVFNGDPNDIKFPEKSRHLISTALAGGAELSKNSEHEFARLVVLKREAHGRSKLYGAGGWRPSLTTGTLIKYQLRPAGTDEQGQAVVEEFEYLICLTPACDTLRLKEKTPFVFLKIHIDSEKYGIVLKDSEGQEVFLRVDQKGPVIRTFFFTPDTSLQRVFAYCVQEGSEKYEFQCLEGKKFSWLGEVRYTRAASEMAGLLRNWMRIGISDSEYLRLINEGRFNF